MQKLRVGFVAQSNQQAQHFLDWITRSQAANAYQVVLLLRLPSTQPGDEATIKKYHPVHFFRQFFLNLISTIEKKWLTKPSDFTNNQQKNNVEIAELLLETTQNQRDFTPDTLHRLETYALDLLVIGDSGPNAAHAILPALLTENFIARFTFGIFKLRYSAQKKCLFSHQAAGFFEVLHQSPATGFAIQRLSYIQEKSEKFLVEETVFQGAIYSVPLFQQNRDYLLRYVSYFLHDFLEKLGNSRELPLVIDSLPFLNTAMHLPSIAAQMTYLINAVRHLASKKIWKLRRQVLRWGVAYQYTNGFLNADLSTSQWIENPPNRFLADPFVVYKNGAHICYMEDYDYHTAKGIITAYEITPNGAQSLGTALEENFHLSYPFIFEDNGTWYMCPETYQSNEIRLYKCIDFPLKWQFHKTLISGVSAADTNIFKLHNKWWMLTNVNSLGTADHNAELHVFFADSLEGVWQAHPLNPVIFDPFRARNGGLIIHNQEVYRVFQVQGFDNYGESMGVAIIKTLSETQYAEEIVSHISNDFFTNLQGAHTLNFNHGLLALDIKRRERL